MLTYLAETFLNMASGRRALSSLAETKPWSMLMILSVFHLKANHTGFGTWNVSHENGKELWRIHLSSFEVSSLPR